MFDLVALAMSCWAMMPWHPFSTETILHFKSESVVLNRIIKEGKYEKREKEGKYLLYTIRYWHHIFSERNDSIGFVFAYHNKLPYNKLLYFLN